MPSGRIAHLANIIQNMLSSMIHGQCTPFYNNLSSLTHCNLSSKLRGASTQLRETVITHLLPCYVTRVISTCTPSCNMYSLAENWIREVLLYIQHKIFTHRFCSQAYFLLKGEVMPKRCVVFGCSNTPGYMITLHSFPKDERICKKWIDYVKTIFLKGVQGSNTRPMFKKYWFYWGGGHCCYCVNRENKKQWRTKKEKPKKNKKKTEKTYWHY